MTCPKCGNDQVSVQTYQENRGSVTHSKTKSKYKEKGHGFFWWLFIGWWWWIVDLFLWVFLFIPRLLVKIFHRKKYVGKSTTTSATVNTIVYTTVYTCQHCGHSWSKTVS